MSDTNGISLADRTGSSRIAGAAQLLKRAVVGSTFAASLDLGLSNSLAHRMLGIRKGIDLPLLPIEFPAAMEPDVPQPLNSKVRELPRPRLLTVARLNKNKNLVELAKSFVAAVQEGLQGSLTIVGEGPERARLEPLWGQVPRRMLLAGSVPFNSSRRLFGAFDGMILPSIYEPWGIVIIEGLGWGLPVLSSRQCGAGVSMALDAGDAVKLCGTSRDELKSSLLGFVGDLDRHAAAARLAAPMVRGKFGMTEVADALIELGNST
jgi:glycosyltransferase involved in cell wall biosynthesis